MFFPSFGGCKPTRVSVPGSSDRQTPSMVMLVFSCSPTSNLPLARPPHTKPLRRWMLKGRPPFFSSLLVSLFLRSCGVPVRSAVTGLPLLPWREGFGAWSLGWGGGQMWSLTFTAKANNPKLKCVSNEDKKMQWLATLLTNQYMSVTLSLQRVMMPPPAASTLRDSVARHMMSTTVQSTK